MKAVISVICFLSYFRLGGPNEFTTGNFENLCKAWREKQYFSLGVAMPGNLPPYSKNLTALAHNWGFLTGAAVLREQPDLFDRLVILNVNSLPDGELTPSRFPNLALACIYLFEGSCCLSITTGKRSETLPGQPCPYTLYEFRSSTSSSATMRGSSPFPRRCSCSRTSSLSPSCGPCSIPRTRESLTNHSIKLCLLSGNW